MLARVPVSPLNEEMEGALVKVEPLLQFPDTIPT